MKIEEEFHFNTFQNSIFGLLLLKQGAEESTKLLFTASRTKLGAQDVT